MSDLVDFLKSYKKKDPSSRSLLEIFFLYPGPKAILLHKIAHEFYGLKLFFFARLISEVSRFLTGIEIHPGARIGKRLVIDHGSGVVIGETTIIGDDCLIFHGTTLGGKDMNSKSKRHPTIGNRCLLGAGCKILGNIVIEDDCKVGANAIILKNIPAHSIVVGEKSQILKNLKSSSQS